MDMDQNKVTKSLAWLKTMLTAGNLIVIILIVYRGGQQILKNLRH